MRRRINVVVSVKKKNFLGSCHESFWEMFIYFIVLFICYEFSSSNFKVFAGTGNMFTLPKQGCNETKDWTSMIEGTIKDVYLPL